MIHSKLDVIIANKLDNSELIINYENNDNWS